MDEDTVLKTAGAYKALKGSNPLASATLYMRQNHKHKITDDVLREAHSRTPHIGKLAVEFGLPHVTVWRRLKQLGLEVLGNRAPNKTIPVEEVLQGLHPHYATYKLKIKMLKACLIQNVCSECNLDGMWNGHPINMELDHINGISSDHRRENLRMLCPNCHSQSDTYCGKNK